MRWEASGGGGAADMQVEVAFAFVYICTRITDFHVPLFLFQLHVSCRRWFRPPSRYV